VRLSCDGGREERYAVPILPIGSGANEKSREKSYNFLLFIFFFKMKKEEIKKRAGAIPSPYDKRDIPFASIPLTEEKKLPGQFSLRSEQTSVKHQGTVGACTAFAACAIDEILQKVNDLSEGHLYCRRENKPGPGMHPRNACKILQKKGVCSESCWPYISNVKILCGYSPCNTINIQSERYKITSYHRVFNSLKATLFSTKSPILIVVPVYENWENIGVDGRVPMPGGNMISYHALVMTGWSKKYLEVKNSWGSFGDEGYLHIPLNYPVTEGWALEKGETNGEEKVKVQSWKIGKKNLFGANVTFTIFSTFSSLIKCQMVSYVNGKKYGFKKRIHEGTNSIHINIPFELNAETNIKLAFISGSFFKHEIIGAWEGTLKVNVIMKNK